MEEVLAVLLIFLGLPWLLFHYITKWKTTPKLTDNDEDMLEELYQLARRLDERMETVERLVASESPEYRREHFDAPRLDAARNADNAKLDELDRLIKERNAR
ncbi:envelope stress response membrane protein PspB [Croceicoccus sp. YJ47]|uniref:envelope stress response membrane protein PspB n=1 Tax=Croceicoccus sp. YJ47 TaxID=2798724 RepID=UPI0019245239|nr:envelope stress response membrane protein PspB [Croceicoccus sp. YJ47]QQN73277.1 envelope stress response membrane protein PspB [Croceicoccus sp. YJ47]